MARELVIDKQQGKIVECTCRECNRRTRHEIVVEATLRGTTGSNFHEVSWAKEYQVVRCLGCESMAFRRTQGSDLDMVQIGEDDWEYQPREEVFPSPVEGRQPLPDHALLPQKVQRIYEESLQALNERQDVLCGIGIRAIVETICKNKKAQGRDLASQINSLVTQGVLTGDGAKILHKLRTLGNKSAHEVKPHSNQELSLAFDVVDHLVLGVYILPKHSKRTFR